MTALGLACYYYIFLGRKLRKVLNDSFSLTFPTHTVVQCLLSRGIYVTSAMAVAN